MRPTATTSIATVAMAIGEPKETARPIRLTVFLIVHPENQTYNTQEMKQVSSITRLLHNTASFVTSHLGRE